MILVVLQCRSYFKVARRLNCFGVPMKALVRALCVVLALISSAVFSATDADRIEQLE